MCISLKFVWDANGSLEIHADNVATSSRTPELPVTAIKWSLFNA